MRRLGILLFALVAGCGSGGGDRGNKNGVSTGIVTTRTWTSPGATTPGTTATPGTTTTRGTTTPSGPSRLLYSANYGDSSLTASRIDATTGVPVPVATVALGDAPLRVVAHPSGRFLYAIERSEITPFMVDATSGALTPVGGGPVVLAGDYPLSARPAPDGALLVVGYYGGGTGGSVRTFTVGVAGDLVTADRHSLGAMANPVDVVLHPNGRFVFVADGVTETITVLSVDPVVGRLAAVGAPLSYPGIAALAVDRAGHFLVAMTSFSPGSVGVLAVDSSGAITARGAPVSTGPHSAMAIETAPDGKTFLVVTANSSLVTLAMDPSGALTTTRVTPVPAHGFPCALAVDASGRFVYTANFAGDDVSVLELGPGGVTAGANVPIAPRTPGNTTQPHWLATVR